MFNQSTEEDSNNIVYIDHRGLSEKISKLGEQEHNYIFSIIKTDTDKYTRNSNGVFLNMTTLSPSTLIKIDQYVKFCETQESIAPSAKVQLK
jgi:hypothetical protein